MERELHQSLYRIVYDLTRDQRTKRVVFADRVIVMIYFWAVIHDRPVAWACQRSHWPSRCMVRLPSASTMSRRLRRESVTHLIQRAERVIAQRLPQSSLCFIDAKPLPIGNASGDQEARAGWAAGRVAKGYKLHAILDAKGTLRHWHLDAMAPHEQTVAPALIRQLQGNGTLVGDNAYDSNRLYDLAGHREWQLVAPRHARTRLGKIPHSPWRLHAHQQMTGQQRESLLHQRKTIERFFGQLGNQTGGLSPLPNHVRSLRRVRLWVQAKLILYHLRLLKKAA